MKFILKKLLSIVTVLFLFNTGAQATVSGGEQIKSSFFNSILTRLGVIENRHPRGYHKNTNCKTGYTFARTLEDGYGYCIKHYSSVDGGMTSFGNVKRCLLDGGRPLGVFDINLIIVADNNTYKTVSGHTTNSWWFYVDGTSYMSYQSMNESGLQGIQVNPFYPCVESGNGSGNSCASGNSHWDYLDSQNDNGETRNLLCGY